MIQLPRRGRGALWSIVALLLPHPAPALLRVLALELSPNTLTGRMISEILESGLRGPTCRSYRGRPVLGRHRQFCDPDRRNTRGWAVSYLLQLERRDAEEWGEVDVGAGAVGGGHRDSVRGSQTHARTLTVCTTSRTSRTGGDRPSGPGQLPAPRQCTRTARRALPVCVQALSAVVRRAACSRVGQIICITGRSSAFPSLSITNANYVCHSRLRTVVAGMTSKSFLSHGSKRRVK